MRDQYSKDVVGLSDLRPVNTNGPLSTDNFFRTNFELPESIHSFCENNPNQHEDFLRACEAFKVWYSKGESFNQSGQGQVHMIFRRIDHFITEGLQSACFYAERFPYSNVGAKSRNDSENQ